MRICCALCLIVLPILSRAQTKPATAPTTQATDLAPFRARLLAATTRHLDQILGADGKVPTIKGKSGDAGMAIGFYRAFELTKNERYRAAAIELTNRVLKDMRATPHGVLFIKEKELAGGGSISGGGPPAFAWYTSAAAYVLHREGGRNDDLKYIATVLDNYAWNEQGWWAADIDFTSGKPKVTIDKPSPINKNATMAMSAAMIGAYLHDIDAQLGDRLKAKADKCIYKQIIPAQQPDGFWQYGLTGKNPGNKDVLGYFMLATEALVQVQHEVPGYRDPAFHSALDKACSFALKTIAPMTDPNHGLPPPLNRLTAATPVHYNLAQEPKRGFELSMVLLAGSDPAEAVKIMDESLKHFPYGNAGQDGARAVHATTFAIMLIDAGN